MKLRCLRERLTEGEAAYRHLLVGPQPSIAGAAFDVEIGVEYIPLGLYLQHGVMWAYIVAPYLQLRVAPLDLFEVIESTIPAEWRVSREVDSGALFIAPPDASTVFFADDVDEIVPQANAVFLRLLKDAGLL
jgi:hypothetical protein